jgi:PAS domain S-box-containing protein
MKVERRRSAVPVPESRVAAVIRQIETHQSQIAQHRTRIDKMQAELRESYARYGDLYELAPVGFLSLDKKGCIREINGRAASLLGSQRNWLIGRPFFVFVANNDIKRFIEILTISCRSNQQESFELLLNVNGLHLPTYIALKTSIVEGAYVHRMTLVDVSDVKKNESHLRTTLDNWLTAVRNTPDTLLTVDRTGEILFANKRYWDRSPDELSGTLIFSYIPENEREGFRRCFDDVFISHSSSSYVVLADTGPGRTWTEFTFGRVLAIDESGLGEIKTTTTTTTTIRIRDISEEKEATEKLRASSDQLREFAANAEAVREEERKRVAREIHDELGQALTVLKLELSWLQTNPPGNRAEYRKKIQSLMEQVDHTIDRMRKIVSELRPTILDDLGLIAAIEWQVKEFQKRTGIRSRMRSNVEDADIAADKAAAVFRVVQEALTNVMRHAKAKSVCVDLKKENGLLKVTVSDDGLGIKDATVKDFKSLGIVGMRERVLRIGGKFKIESIPKSGTRVEIVLGI